MNDQSPAEGILKSNDWGDTKTYQVTCSCDDPDHDHRVWIEATDTSVDVSIFVNIKSMFWKESRWRQIWQILSRGHVSCETTIVMTEQQALNYAKTLEKAVHDVKYLKKS
jgi:sugar/nucleoside kinase (ribokinase family)